MDAENRSIAVGFASALAVSLKTRLVTRPMGVLSSSETKILALGFSFCPASQADNFEVVKDVNLFARRLTYINTCMTRKGERKKQELIERGQWKGFTVQDFMALKDLVDLLDENETAMGGSAEGGPPESLSEVSPQAQSHLVNSRFRKKIHTVSSFENKSPYLDFSVPGHFRY